MKTVRLITCNDAMQAHILQGALENEGIDSLLHNENFSSLLKSYVSNISGVDIFVNEEDYDHALQVLRDNQSLPEELKYYMKAACAVVFSLLAATPHGDNHWTYECRQCKAFFERPVSATYKQDEES